MISVSTTARSCHRGLEPLGSLCDCDSLAFAPLRQVDTLLYPVGGKAREIDLRQCESLHAHLTASWLPAGAYVTLE